MAYDPITDSNDIGRKRLVMELDHAPGPLIVIEPGECLCGCHERPSRRSRWFKPGHDNRFRGILIRAAEAGVPVTVDSGKGREELPAAAWQLMLARRPAADEKQRRVVRRATELVQRADDLTDDEYDEMMRLLARLGIEVESQTA